MAIPKSFVNDLKKYTSSFTVVFEHKYGDRESFVLAFRFEGNN